VKYNIHGVFSDNSVLFYLLLAG